MRIYFRSWRREVFNSNILLGGRRDMNEENHATKEFHPVVGGPVDGESGPASIETAAAVSVASSSSNPPPIHYRPVSSRQFHPHHPITHITHVLNDRYQTQLVFSDAAGQIFVYDPSHEVVSHLLIPTHLQPSHETSSSDSTISSPHSWMDIEECVEEVPGVDSYERAFRAEMVKNGLKPFRSSQPILDLKVNMENHWATPVEDPEDAKGRICIQTIDLVHAHSITRIGYFASESFFWSKEWNIPQVIHINTILTLPTSVTIASCTFFPGLPRGPYVEVGPLIFTQVGSGHIYMVRPNSTRPPAILVHDKDIQTMMPPTTSSCCIDSTSPPLLCREEYIRDIWKQVEGSPGNHPLLVMLHGYVFRISFNPIKLSMTEIELVIGNSPDRPSTTLAPFFRRNAHEYCLQELNRDIFILDRVEGSVSQFSRDGELKQCIEPSPPPGLTYCTPFQDFFVHEDASISYQFSLNIHLIDSFGAAIHLWTTNHFKQRQYDLDGYPAKSTPTIRMKRPKPLRSAIILPPTVITPAVPLVFTATGHWVPYQSPLTRGLTRLGHVVGAAYFQRLIERCTSDAQELWSLRWSLREHVRFWFRWLIVPFVIGYAARLGYEFTRDSLCELDNECTSGGR